MPELDASQRRQVLWLFAIALLVLGAGLCLRDAWPADETGVVLVAKQMVEGGDWWVPHRGQELYPDKPPLYFWILAGMHAVVGEWRIAFLLPSLFAGLGVLWLVYDLARRLWNHRAGVSAAVAVLCCLQFVYQFKRAQIDPTLVLATTLALYGLLRHRLLGPSWAWYYLGCAAAGAGVVLKGVGFLPLLVLLPAMLMRRAGWNGLAPIHGQAWRWALGALAFLAPILAWLLPMVAMALADGDPAHRAYLDNLLFKQTATRYAEAWHHHKPAWYFLGVMALFWLPFSLAFGWFWRDWRDAWRSRDARVWLPLAWAVLVLLFFSASPGKRDMYILPMLPAVALDPSSSARRLMQQARTAAGPDVTIGLVRWKEQNLLQAIGPTAEFGFRRPAEEQMRLGARWLEAAPTSRRLLMSQPRAQPTCFAPADIDGRRVVKVGSANRRDWYLVSREGLAARCFSQGLDASD